MKKVKVRQQALKDIHQYLVEKGYRIRPEGEYFDTWDVNTTWISDNTTLKMTFDLNLYGVNRKK